MAVTRQVRESTIEKGVSELDGFRIGGSGVQSSISVVVVAGREVVVVADSPEVKEKVVRWM